MLGIAARLLGENHFAVSVFNYGVQLTVPLCTRHLLRPLQNQDRL
jgi:hypothetical protein